MPPHPPQNPNPNPAQNPPPNPEPGRIAGPAAPQSAPGPQVGRPTAPGVPPRAYGAPRGYGSTGPGQPAPGNGSVPGYGPAQGYTGQPTQAYGAPTPGLPGPAHSMGTATATGPVVDPPKKRELTVNKVVAGAGAAATSAVLGSFFGAAGTIGGAALGSVFSTVVTSLYEHSLDRTANTVKAKVKLPGGRTVDVAGRTEVPAPPVAPGGETGTARVYVTPGDRPTEMLSADDRPTEVLSAVPANGAVDAGPPNSRRRLLVMAGFTVVVFALGLLAVTGIELLKGSPLNTGGDGSGTSVGRVLTGGSSTGSTDDTSSETTGTEEPSSEPTTAARSSAERTAEPGTGFGASDEPAPTTASKPRVTPTPTPQSGGGSGSGGQAAGGAVVTAPGQ
jgi:hypothetical protein